MTWAYLRDAGRQTREAGDRDDRGGVSAGNMPSISSVREAACLSAKAVKTDADVRVDPGRGRPGPAAEAGGHALSAADVSGPGS